MKTWTRMLGILTLASITLVGSAAVATAATKEQPGAVMKVKGKNKGKDAKRVTFDATFDRYLVSPAGHVDGMLLSDGSVVRIPRGVTVDTTVKKGETIRVEAHMHALPDGTIYTRPLVTKGTATIVDGTNPKKPEAKNEGKPQLSDLKVSGTVSSFLIDQKGEKYGVILADGTIAYAHHTDLAAQGVKLGDAVTIEGKGGTYPQGKSVWIKSMKLPNGTTVAPKPLGPKDKQ